MSKSLKGLLILIGCQFVGELISLLLPINLPGPICGFIVLLILLISGAIKQEQVEKVSNFLLDNMLIFFIPGTISLLLIFPQIKGVLLKLIIVTIISTVLVFSVTAITVQFMIQRKEKHANDEDTKHAHGTND